MSSYILGLSCFYHDSAAALIKNGEIVAAAQEERFSRKWSLWIGFPGIIIGLTNPRLLYFPYKFWIKLGLTLGWINSRIILGLVFMIVLLPISFLMCIFGYDPLKIKRKGETTYRENRKEHQTDLTRIF